MEKHLVFQGAALYDGNCGQPVDDSVIVIKNGVFEFAGRKEDYNFPENYKSGCSNYEVIDVSGKSIIPGLIDLHVHTIMLKENEMLQGLSEEMVAETTLRGARNLQQAVINGVTTVRDCGSPHMGIFSLKKAVDSGLLEGPRVFPSGVALRATGGHGPQIAAVADGEVEVRRESRRQIKAGAEWIKFMVTGGTATEGEQVTDVQYTIAEMAAAVEEAHRRGKKVTGHISNLEGVKAALAAGFDCVEHGIELDEFCIEEMLKNNTALVNCICLTNREAEAGPESGLPEYVRVKAGEIARKQIASFQRAYRAGIKIGLGTDSDGLFHPFGESVHWELEWLVKCGMSPCEALYAATTGAAEILGCSDKIGRIQKGYHADLVVLEGDVFRDITSVKNISVVVRDGKIII